MQILSNPQSVMKWLVVPAVLFMPIVTCADQHPNKMLLPDEFKVYFNEKAGLSRTSFRGASEKVIPTNNEFKESPGCYRACYSKDAKSGVYPLGEGVYMVGQLRVSGHYTNGMCMPKGFENKDVRTDKSFKEKCASTFPEKCTGTSCWADSHTGNWFY